MRTRTLGYALIVSGTIFACAGAAAQDAPQGNKGYTTLKTAVIDLGAEIPSMAGWQLRLRMLEIEPGGHIGLTITRTGPPSWSFNKAPTRSPTTTARRKPFTPAIPPPRA